MNENREISADVFILTDEWLDHNGKNILKLIGKSNEIGPVQILITNNKPVFFVENSAILNPLQKNFLRKETKLKNFNHQPVDAVYLNTQKELVVLADSLHQSDIKTFESDIDPLRRYLMEKGINSQLKVTGAAEQKKLLTRFINPVIEPAVVNPQFIIASLDIETSTKSNQLYSIAVHVTGKQEELKKVFMLGEKPKSCPDYTLFYDEERDLLINFFNWFKEIDPDIIIGWHVIGFDLLFLDNKCRELGISLDIARANGRVSIRQRKPSGYYISLTGRVVIDGPAMLRASFFSFEDFKLETVAQELLGKGKTITPDTKKVEEIERQFREDKIALAEYNLQDAVLVTDIFKKTGLIELSVRRAQISGMLMDQLGMMTAAFDHLYLPKLHQSEFVAPNLKDIYTAEHAAGGYVIDPVPGIYENVVVLDFKSLYPSIMQTFKIDPYSLLMKETDTIETLNGYRFSYSLHILPDFIDELMKQRDEAKKKKDKQLSQAIKILMNSFYGVMGSYNCRFYHPDLPRAITGSGHKLLLGSKEYLEKKELKVIYGDTDSLFVMLKNVNDESGELQGKKIVKELNKFWKEKLKKEYKVESHLELQFEKYYKQFIITPARGADTGAKKRYAGLVLKDDKENIEFVGMEFVRSDWTNLAKDFQIELYEKIFHKEEVEDWIREVIKKLKSGNFDDKLIYKKRLRKEIEDYTKNIPPHVRAAKLLNEPADVIYYVITQRGPIPIELKHNDFDYDHYIEKQLKPIADSVLFLLGKNFDDIAGSDQLSFF
ncbi:MAG: DNA polymerase II [Ignavibacteriaceae bacterium]|jgi:DNA polymerase-2|nr:DNA polymerase II [Ignavibacteriaceae bacterium]